MSSKREGRRGGAEGMGGRDGGRERVWGKISKDESRQERKRESHDKISKGNEQWGVNMPLQYKP